MSDMIVYFVESIADSLGVTTDRLFGAIMLALLFSFIISLLFCFQVGAFSQ